MTVNLNRLYQRNIPRLLNQLQGTNQPAINRHMQNLMTGQRTFSDDYVKRAASAGIQRGGMNVVGGSPLQSALALQATKGLASQYATHYGQAVNHANADRSSGQQLFGHLMTAAHSTDAYAPGLQRPRLPRRSTGPNSAVPTPAAWQSDGQESTYQQWIARRNADQDRRWELQQRRWQEHDRAQRVGDSIRADSRAQVAFRQAQQDRAQKLQEAGRDKRRADRAYHRTEGEAALGLGTRGPVKGKPSVPTYGSHGYGDAQRVPTRAEKQLADFQTQYQKQKMLNDLALQAQQTRQSAMQTKKLALDLSADQYKQNAWMRAQNPYVQTMNAYLGLGGQGYGGMNNARLGQARIAADVWAGLTKPSSRNFSWSSTSNLSGQRQAYTGSTYL